MGGKIFGREPLQSLIAKSLEDNMFRNRVTTIRQT